MDAFSFLLFTSRALLEGNENKLLTVLRVNFSNFNRLAQLLLLRTFSLPNGTFFSTNHAYSMEFHPGEYSSSSVISQRCLLSSFLFKVSSRNINLSHALIDCISIKLTLLFRNLYTDFGSLIYKVSNDTNN